MRRALLVVWFGAVAAFAQTAAKGTTPIQLAWPPARSAYTVEYVESITKPTDLSIRRGFFSKLNDLVFGASNRPEKLFRPFAIHADSAGRLLVTDPGTLSVHLFDPGRKKHKVLESGRHQHFVSPIAAVTDAVGNIYVSDSFLGKIFVFDKDGHFRRFYGDLRGEGFFKRPTGLAFDQRTGKLYLTDTLRHKVYVLDQQGRVERDWGTRGSGPGEFNFPTDIALSDDRVFVLDSMNFRVQVFDLNGSYLNSFGQPVNEPGGFFRPKGLAIDRQHNLIYVVDSMFEVVQAFSFDGKLAMAFGHPGNAPGEFRLPAGVCVGPDGRMFVADSYNRRVQVFRVRATATTTAVAEVR